MGGHVAVTREKMNAYRVLVGKREGKRPLGRHRHRQENKIKVNFVELGWGGMEWFLLALDCNQW
jgi:hypothetical protein